MPCRKKKTSKVQALVKLYEMCMYVLKAPSGCMYHQHVPTVTLIQWFQLAYFFLHCRCLVTICSQTAINKVLRFVLTQFLLEVSRFFWLYKQNCSACADAKKKYSCWAAPSGATLHLVSPKSIVPLLIFFYMTVLLVKPFPIQAAVCFLLTAMTLSTVNHR